MCLQELISLFGQNNEAVNELSVARLKRDKPSDSKRFSHSKEEEYYITELLNSRSITVACQKHDSYRMDTHPERIIREHGNVDVSCMKHDRCIGSNDSTPRNGD
ncbi:hypothetical protein EV1_034408 [Malus domestica]